MRSLLFILFCISVLSCTSKSIKIAFINQSGLKLDSSRIELSSANTYSIPKKAINELDTLEFIIPRKKIKSNKHDVTVSITLYSRHFKPIYEYSYNDLSGSFFEEYTVLFNKERKVEWLP